MVVFSVCVNGPVWMSSKIGVFCLVLFEGLVVLSAYEVKLVERVCMSEHQTMCNSGCEMRPFRRLVQAG